MQDMPIDRYTHDILLPRAWELHHNITAYDGVYIALAEILSAPFLTRDSRLVTAPGCEVYIEVI